MGKHTAIYARVSTTQQSLRSQRPDLERWIAAQGPELGDVKWYTDQATGRNMNRPGWQQLQRAMEGGQVDRIVVWRLDRLGRSAGALCSLFDQLNRCQVRLISLKEMVDLRVSGTGLKDLATVSREIEQIKEDIDRALAAPQHSQ